VSAPEPADRSAATRAGTPPPGEQRAGSPVVEVRVAAAAAQLPVLRAVTGDLAMRADFDVDAIDDLRLAVDEACSTLVGLAAESATLVCRFLAEEHSITLSAAVTSDDSRKPREDTFSWRVLSALADSVSTSVEPNADADGGHVVRIELTKGRTHE